MTIDPERRLFELKEKMKKEIEQKREKLYPNIPPEIFLAVEEFLYKIFPYGVIIEGDPQVTQETKKHIRILIDNWFQNSESQKPIILHYFKQEFYVKLSS